MTDLERAAASLRARLVAQLHAAGVLTEPAWLRAFQDVPRHHFVPAYQRRTGDGPPLVTATTEPEQWLAGVYRNQPLVTGEVSGVATSSSTEPALMATMLQALDLAPGQQVLEIGTGTGYNAALLCARIGDRLVTSIEVDQQIAGAAAAQLAGLGYRPRIEVGDGLAGCPKHGPYDRIIATCGISSLPESWRRQLSPEGVIVANIGYGLAKLRHCSGGGVVGRFLPTTAAFIEARPAGVAPPLPVADAIALATGGSGDSREIVAAESLDDPEFWFVARLLLPTVAYLVLHPDAATQRRHLLVDSVTRSWARAEFGGGAGTVAEGGARRLWTELTEVDWLWRAAGSPAHDQLGLRVDPDGRHHLWVGDPAKPFTSWQPAATSTQLP